MTFPNEVEYGALWGMIHVHDDHPRECTISIGRPNEGPGRCKSLPMPYNLIDIKGWKLKIISEKLDLAITICVNIKKWIWQLKQANVELET